MATKSFTSDFTFSKESVDNLMEALDNNNLPNRATDISVKEIKDTNSIKRFFNKG